LTVFDVYDDCEDYDEVVVTSMAGVPNLSVTIPEVLTCAQELVTLDATGSDNGTDFLIDWTTADGNIVEGDNTLNPVVDQPGTYTLSILDLTNGCLGEMSVTVDADYSVPSFTTSDGMLTCTVSEVDICVSPQNPGDIVIWEDDFEGLCRTVSIAGTYSFMVYGLNGCSAAGETQVTMDANVPVSSAGEDRLLTCTAPDVTLDGSASSAGEQFSYQWQDADGNVLGNEVTLNVTVPGVYTLLVTNLDNGCSSQDEVLVDEFINTADPDFTTDLDYNILTLISTSQNPDEESTWTSSDGQIATGIEAQFIYMQGGEYEICHAVTNECGTETTCQTVSVTILPLTFEGVVEHITCPGGQDGKIAVTPAGGIADYLVDWTGPDGFTAESFELSGLAAGSYTMQLSDAAGTMVEEIFELVQPAAFEAQFEVSDEIDGNANGAIDMTIAGGTPPYSFAWSNGITTEDIENLAAGDYELTVTDSRGCEFTVTVTVDMRTNLFDITSVALFEVRPNPTFSDLRVDLGFTERPQGRLILLDQLGQVIETRLLQDMNQEENFILGDLKAGIYFIQLELRDVTLVKKAVKL
jgi:hypothetical protein